MRRLSEAAAARAKDLPVRQLPAWAGLVHPGSARVMGPAAGVLASGDRPAAAPAALAAGPDRGRVQGRWRPGGRFQVETDRAGGRHREADAAQAEVVEVRLTHLLVDPHSLPSPVGRRPATDAAGASPARNTERWRVLPGPPRADRQRRGTAPRSGPRRPGGRRAAR